jgi:hypothetical protein
MLKRKESKQDINQKTLECFFVSPRNVASPLTARDTNANPLPIQDASQDAAKKVLTPEQQALIDENRRRALARREERLKQANLDPTQTQLVQYSQDTQASQEIPPTQQMVLSQEQLQRIAQKRSEALEIRRKRQEAMAIATASEPGLPETPRSRTPEPRPLVAQTPEPRRRRPLVAQLTDPPPPLPVHFALMTKPFSQKAA